VYRRHVIFQRRGCRSWRDGDSIDQTDGDSIYILEVRIKQLFRAQAVDKGGFILVLISCGRNHRVENEDGSHIRREMGLIRRFYYSGDFDIDSGGIVRSFLGMRRVIGELICNYLQITRLGSVLLGRGNVIRFVLATFFLPIRFVGRKELMPHFDADNIDIQLDQRALVAKISEQYTS